MEEEIVKNLTRKMGDAYLYDNYTKTELAPVYEGRKSFYRKAFVIHVSDNLLLLQSYDTIVACILNGEYIELGKYSQTTSRHQWEFKKQFSK